MADKSKDEKIKICIYTSLLYDYINSVSVQSIKEYATIIGADYIEISKRVFNEFPVNYEMMQIYDLGKEYDWNIYINPDVIINKNMIDMTKQCDSDKVGTWGPYGASSWFELDDYFKNDTKTETRLDNSSLQCMNCHHLQFLIDSGKISYVEKTIPRDIAISRFMICCPSKCHDLWKPTELSYNDAIVYAKRDLFISEWNLSRNIAINKYNIFNFESDEKKNGAQDNTSVFINLDVLNKSKENKEKLVKYDDEELTSYMNGYKSKDELKTKEKKESEKEKENGELKNE